MILRRIPAPKQLPPPIAPPSISKKTNTIDFCKENIFTIYHFKTNAPLEFIRKEKNGIISFLSANESGAELIYAPEEDGSGRQKWIIESDESDPSIYYVKNTFYHKLQGIKYIGCPNKSGLAYLYTSKNQYTKWHILSLGDSRYEFKYVGNKFDPAKISLVVARYNEPIDWLIPYNDIVIIYNKGHEIIEGFSRVVHVENIGREGHTYLYHIIQNYENISENTIFTQCDPFAHNPTILFGIDNHFLLEPVQPLGLRYLKSWNLPPLEYVEKNKTVTNFGLEYLVVKSDGDLINYDFHDVGIVELRLNADKDYPDNKNRNKPLVEGFLSRAGFPYTPLLGEKMQFTYCGMFSIHKTRILFHSVELYQNLMSELVRKNTQGGVNGYILEKTWLYIFQNATNTPTPTPK